VTDGGTEGEIESDRLADAALLRAHVDGDPENLDRWSRLGSTMTKDPVEIKEQRSFVAAALGTLNADQRAALVLVDMEGYSVDEAAEILGCAPGTVKSRCARGRARLLPLLGHLTQAEAGS
jgi:RNA polymerase sigma-70 factor (ECF subfamily)